MHQIQSFAGESRRSFLQWRIRLLKSEPKALSMGRFGFSLACIELRLMRLQSAFLKTKFMTTVQAGSFLTLHYRLAGPQGTLINTFEDKPATLSLGSGELSPGMEAALMGLEEGVRTTFELASGVAFGDRNPDMQQWVARKLLAQLGAAQEHYVPGDVVQFPTPDGHGTYAGAVMQAADDGAVLFDFNHPLAGHPVTFEVHVIGIL